MEKFTAMLNKLGLRGSSEDGLDGRRSAQSTPRMKRQHQVRDPSHDSHRSYGSLGSVEVHRVRPRDRDRSLDPADPASTAVGAGGAAAGGAAGAGAAPRGHNHSWECERVHGLDRSWEAERAKGMELLYRSVEREKEREKGRVKDRHQERGRSRHRRHHKHKSSRHHQVEPVGAERQEMWVMGGTRDPMELMDPPPPPTIVQGPTEADVTTAMMERQIEDLNQQLQEEKQHNRRDKLTVARLQREISRNKSDGPLVS